MCACSEEPWMVGEHVRVCYQPPAKLLDPWRPDRTAISEAECPIGVISDVYGAGESTRTRPRVSAAIAGDTNERNWLRQRIVEAHKQRLQILLSEYLGRRTRSEALIAALELQCPPTSNARAQVTTERRLLQRIRDWVFGNIPSKSEQRARIGVYRWHDLVDIVIGHYTYLDTRIGTDVHVRPAWVYSYLPAVLDDYCKSMPGDYGDHLREIWMRYRNEHLVVHNEDLPTIDDYENLLELRSDQNSAQLWRASYRKKWDPTVPGVIVFS